jgi:hypothetical protein
MLFAGTLAGGAINPARVFGPALAVQLLGGPLRLLARPHHRRRARRPRLQSLPLAEEPVPRYKGCIQQRRAGPARPYSWSRVIQQAARRASRRSPQPPVNNSAQTQSLPVNNTVVYSRIRPPFARGAGVTNSRPQASSFDGRLSHPGASPRPKTNPQMTSVNSHPIRTSLDLGPRGFPINLIVKGILS